MLTTALNNAQSGLNANSVKLANSASNIANAQSTRTNGENTVYQPRDTYTVTQPTGGVIAYTQLRDPATVQSLSLNNPLANEDGLIELPNVNLDEELITQAQASNAYQANAVVMNKANDLAETLINALNEEA